MMGSTSTDDGSSGRFTEQHLRYVAAGLAFVVAIVHLFHPDRGFPRLVQVVTFGWDHLLYDPRPIAFVLSGFAIVVGINLVLLGVSRRRIYVLGTALMAVFLVGYFGWHFSGHGGFLPAREPNYHGMGPIEAAVSHLRGDPWARVAVLSETALFVVLAYLYRKER